MFVTHLELISRPDLKKPHTQEIWNCSTMKITWHGIWEWGYNLEIKPETFQEMVLKFITLLFFLFCCLCLGFVSKGGQGALIPLCLLFKDSSVILWMFWGKNKKKKSFSWKQNGKDPVIPRVTMMKNKLRAKAPYHRSSLLITWQSKGKKGTWSFISTWSVCKSVWSCICIDSALSSRTDKSENNGSQEKNWSNLFF